MLIHVDDPDHLVKLSHCVKRSLDECKTIRILVDGKHFNCLSFDTETLAVTYAEVSLPRDRRPEVTAHEIKAKEIRIIGDRGWEHVFTAELEQSSTDQTNAE